MRNWPLFDLRLRTPRIELHVPNLAELDELADVAAAGVHDAAVMPFAVPWTDTSPEDRARSTVQYAWRHWASWTPEDWTCSFAVVENGQVVGVQEMHARDFAITREVGTGSWLGRRFQGRGIGTQMRAAELALAFEGLDARWAVSGAFLDNPASLGVSRKFGYEPDGVRVRPRRGEVATEQRLRLSQETWAKHRFVPVQISGLDRCRAQFGA